MRDLPSAFPFQLIFLLFLFFLLFFSFFRVFFLSFAAVPPLWSRVTKNPLARPFNCWLALLTRSLALHCSLCLRAHSFARSHCSAHLFSRSLTYSRARGKVNDSMAILAIFLLWTIVPSSFPLTLLVLGFWLPDRSSGYKWYVVLSFCRFVSVSGWTNTAFLAVFLAVP